MAKSILTKEAIKYLIETYDCETTNYTFTEVANMIAEKFAIKVSSEAVRKSYLKYKGSFDVVKADNKAVQVEKPKKVFERTEQVKPKTGEGFNDSAGETLSKSDIKGLLD